jgi:ketosteroid isomerase-like protein
MNLTAEQVKAEITRYWKSFMDKDAASLGDFYAHESVGFSSTSRRSEPGRMAAIRREREYFQNSGHIQATIDGVEVILLGESAAVAAYTFRFHAGRSEALGNITEEDIQDGRATQVFAFDADGRLRIFHEHFSEAAA